MQSFCLRVGKYSSHDIHPGCLWVWWESSKTSKFCVGVGGTLGTEHFTTLSLGALRPGSFITVLETRLASCYRGFQPLCSLLSASVCFLLLKPLRRLVPAMAALTPSQCGRVSTGILNCDCLEFSALQSSLVPNNWTLMMAWLKHPWELPNNVLTSLKLACHAGGDTLSSDTQVGFIYLYFYPRLFFICSF